MDTQSKDLNQPRVTAGSSRQEPQQETAKTQEAANDLRQEVRLVSRQDDLSLVEWNDKNNQPRRAWLPAKEVSQWKDGTYHATEPERGVPYGDNLRGMVKMAATPEALEQELHRRGVWTADDVLANAATLHGALQAVYGLDAATLMTAAAEFKRAQRK